LAGGDGNVAKEQLVVDQKNPGVQGRADGTSAKVSLARGPEKEAGGGVLQGVSSKRGFERGGWEKKRRKEKTV